MCTVMVPASAGEALGMLESAQKMQRVALAFLADLAAADMPTSAMAGCLRALEQNDAVEAAARGQLLAAFDAQDGSVADGQRTARTWLVHVTRVTRRQAAEHKAVQALAERHRPLLAGLREQAVTKSVALQLAKWTAAIPGEFREKAEEILVAAARAGADLRALASICAEIRSHTAVADPDDENDRHLDRGLSFDMTFDGAGVLRGDLTPECAAMVQAVLDALSAPAGGGDLRTRPQRYHDALEEAMRRLLASDLLPKRAGQPAKALVHIYFAELLDMDQDSIFQDKWIAEYRAQWAAHRAAASVSTGDGGAWLEGDAARAIACDAMLVPVVTGDIDPTALDELIVLCARYHQIRTPAAPGNQATQAVTVADALAELEHQILAQVLQVVSGPGGAASFLRRNLLGKGLGGPSLPLDVGQADDIPVHLRRLVALRDQTCQYPGGCDQPASGCEPHHVQHRADGGHTSLDNLKDYCWWHHHVVLHEIGWKLTVHPDGTSEVTSPTGRIIRSHSPPPLPG
jgi:hypothetical protein